MTSLLTSIEFTNRTVDQGVATVIGRRNLLRAVDEHLKMVDRECSEFSSTFTLEAKNQEPHYCFRHL